MLAIATGAISALLVHYATGLTWPLPILFFVGAVLSQFAYARSLNVFLGGADPVATFGAKNLSDLKGKIRIPCSVSALCFIAKAFAWAGIASLLMILGIIRV